MCVSLFWGNIVKFGLPSVPTVLKTRQDVRIATFGSKFVKIGCNCAAFKRNGLTMGPFF